MTDSFNLKPMKLSKLDIIKLIYSEHAREPLFKMLRDEVLRFPEFEFIAIAENKLRQKLTICRKNTYLIG